MDILAIRCGAMIIWKDGFASCPPWVHNRIQDAHRIMIAVCEANLEKMFGESHED